MQSKRNSAVLASALLAGSAVLFTSAAYADDKHQDHHRDSRHDDRHDQSNVSAAFGRGLNTTQPQGNPLNNAILPKWIEVDAGGVVNFALAGFHHIIIFKPGFRREDLDAFIPASGTFIFPNDPTVALPSAIDDKVYYRGINPAGGPPATPFVGSPSNASNRGEPVAFVDPGIYLVICNVRPHLLDGMYAYVRVKRDD